MLNIKYGYDYTAHEIGVMRQSDDSKSVIRF